MTAEIIEKEKFEEPTCELVEFSFENILAQGDSIKDETLDDLL